MTHAQAKLPINNHHVGMMTNRHMEQVSSTQACLEASLPHHSSSLQRKVMHPPMHLGAMAAMHHLLLQVTSKAMERAKGEMSLIPEGKPQGTPMHKIRIVALHTLIGVVIKPQLTPMDHPQVTVPVVGTHMVHRAGTSMPPPAGIHTAHLLGHHISHLVITKHHMVHIRPMRHLHGRHSKLLLPEGLTATTHIQCCKGTHVTAD